MLTFAINKKDFMNKIVRAIQFQAWWIYRLLFKPCNLEIHLSEHCNLNCISCSHYSPLATPKFCDVYKLRISLSKLSCFASEFRAIRLLGGEPLLNPNIVEIISIVRDSFPDTDIQLVTNGLLLMPPYAKHINEIFWEACRHNKISIAITVYPTGTDTKEIKRICLNNGVNFSIYGVRTGESGFELYSLDPKCRGNILNYYRCRDMDCLQLADGKIFSCSQCAYVEHLNKAFGCNFKQSKRDYIDVNNIDSKFTIRRFRWRAKPFCKYCIFPRQKTNWHRSQRMVNEWVYQ